MGNIERPYLHSAIATLSRLNRATAFSKIQDTKLNATVEPAARLTLVICHRLRFTIATRSDATFFDALGKQVLPDRSRAPR